MNTARDASHNTRMFVRTNKVVRTAALLGLLINFGIMPLTVFQTPYVSDYLRMGPETLSYIKILMTLGMMAGAALTPKVSGMASGRGAAGAGAAMGLSLVTMAFVPRLVPGIAGIACLTASMFVVGFGGGVLNVIVGSSTMRSVPKELMGRVSGFLAAVMQASMPVASFLCSALAVWFDVPTILFAFGLLTVACYAALACKRRLGVLG